jgi:hypothetical protein
MIRADTTRHAANRGKAARKLTLTRSYRASAAAITASEWGCFVETVGRPRRHAFKNNWVRPRRVSRTAGSDRSGLQYWLGPIRRYAAYFTVQPYGRVTGCSTGWLSSTAVIASRAYGSARIRSATCVDGMLSAPPM